jgi:6-pyruvoyltetrahydropterin/6-carboxytetrahydropterin synthase
VDEKTGMVMNLEDLKKYIKTAVLDQFDHKHIDKDIPYFRDKVSTTENVAVYIWKSLLETQLPKELLYEVRIHETENNVVIYRGE